MTNLRPYQRAAIDAVLSYWQAGGGNPLVDMATGTGKSVVIATLVRELLEAYPTLRVVMLVHVKELVEQNARALLRAWPQAPIGINSAGLGRRDKRSQILFASIQSIFREDSFSLGSRDLVLIDEAHLVPKAGEGMYRTFLDKLRETTPDLRVAGFTATPYRLDSGRLDQGPERLFSEIVYSYGIGQGITDGFLSPLQSKATATALDVSGVAKRGGEFIAGALEAAVDKDWITRAAVQEIVTFGQARRSWLLFAAGVDHALHLRDAVRSHGIAAETVTGETPKGERDRIIRDFREGRIRCLTNAMVLTTGFDAPSVDLVAMLRPTLSTGLYVQIVGRGTRLAPGKDDCLVLDFAGNVRRHGPVDAISVRPGSAGGKEDAAVKEDSVRAKECPGCQALVALNTRVCQHCGHEWPKQDEPKHDARADSERPIMSVGGAVWLPVTSVRYFRHSKPGSPTSLRVEYICNLALYRQWQCFEHNGFARNKAENWWRRMASGTPPETVEEALSRQNEIRRATAIQVRPSGQYFEIVGVRHDPPRLEAAE